MAAVSLLVDFAGIAEEATTETTHASMPTSPIKVVTTDSLSNVLHISNPIAAVMSWMAAKLQNLPAPCSTESLRLELQELKVRHNSILPTLL